MKRIIVLSLIGMFFFFNVGAQEDVSTVKKGIKVKPTVAMHGRIQYDFEFLNRTMPDVDDYSFAGQEFRRVYLSGSGTIYKNIKYKAQLELAGGKVAYRDMYIKLADLPGIGGDLSFGSVGEATGFDMATSSKYITFLERAMMTNTQAFRWNSGIHYSNFGILNKHLGLQMSYAFNGSHKDGFFDNDLNRGAHFVVRLTSPYVINKEKNQMIHFGINYENRKRSEEAADYKLKFRPANHMGGKTSIGIAGLESQSDVGFELMAMFGPISILGEYEIAGYQTSDETYNVNSYHADVSYFVFGGRKAYKKGAFSRVKPFENFCVKDHEYGALELAVRYEAIDYSSIVTGDNADQVSNIVLGLNYYLNSHTRLMYNYVITDYNDENNTNNLNANLLRLQVDF